MAIFTRSITILILRIVFLPKKPIGNYSIEERFKFALSLVDTVAYLHKQRIVHQNLYLDSIFLISGDIKIDHIGLRRSLTKMR